MWSSGLKDFFFFFLLDMLNISYLSASSQKKIKGGTTHLGETPLSRKLQEFTDWFS